MASSHKYFSNHDRVVATNQLLEEVDNEQVLSWTSASFSPYYFVQYGSGSDIFPLSTKVFDLTVGRSSDTTNDVNGTSLFQVEKNIYNQFAKVLLGHDSNNNIVKFSLEESSTEKVLHNAYFITFARNQFKDRIKEGSVNIKLNLSGTINASLVDSGSTGTEVRTCNAGTYGKLFLSASSYADELALKYPYGTQAQGLVFYEAGVAVVSPYIFSKYNSSYAMPSGSNEYLQENEAGALDVTDAPILSGTYNIKDLLISGSIVDNCNALSSKILTASYYSVTELNSTIYFCRAFNHEFNYSSNPTYLKNSEIVIKNGDPEIQPRAYITTVGLYSEDNQLLAVAKLSEPVLKTPENELIARVRLDF